MKKNFSIRGEGIRVQKTKDRGRGIIAERNFKKGDVIMINPVVVIPESEKELIKKTELFNYYFDWGARSKKAAICLGLGSICNHSWTPNAKYVYREKDEMLVFVAIKPIKRGEEICISYNGDAADKSPYYFRKNGRMVNAK
ncbi:MAG: SET domain-containing protein-lysine N-methyltransferase [Patescibacteria group bacterium]